MPVDATLSTGSRVRPLPPLPKSGLSLPQPSIRRVMSETRPSKGLPRPMPALPTAIQAAWEKENEAEGSTYLYMSYRRKKYGLPAHPRDAPAHPSGRTLRPTPDSRRLNPKRDLDNSTAEVMRAHLGEQGDIHAHALALSGHYGGMDAHWAALDVAYARMDDQERAAREQEMRQRGALDLAMAMPRKGSVAHSVRKSSTQLERKESAQADRRASAQTERKGSGVTLLLPEFTLIRGSMPLSPGQGIPTTPEPDSPHSPFEWDNPSPFGGPLFAPHWNASHWTNNGRPVSVDEHQSASRKASQPELDIELARKPRPATVLPSAATASSSDAGSVSGNGSGKKRLGVILNPGVVKDELARRFGSKQV